VFTILWHSLCSFLGFSGRFFSYLQPNFPAISGSYLPGFSGRICSYWQPNFPVISGSYLPRFSGRICTYWQPNFPTVFVVTWRDFLALPFLAPEGRDFPAISVVSGRDFPAVAFLAWVIKKNSMGRRQIVLVSTVGFSVLNKGIFWREAKTKRLFSQCNHITIKNHHSRAGSVFYNLSLELTCLVT
jgi:hypothetical protein